VIDLFDDSDAQAVADDPLAPVESVRPDQEKGQRRVMIRVEDVHKSFGDKEVLKGVSFEVHENEILALIGTSGCGKSTLLNVISGLEQPTSGQVFLDDTNYTMVFQYSALFDSMTIFDNVAFSLVEKPDVSRKELRKKKRYSKEEVDRLVREKLHLLNLDDIEDRFPNELSGGMQKRVSFARAVVGNPKIILYDEPTAGLDPIASTVLEDYMLKLRDELKAASIVVTHQFSTIQRTADKICLLHEGKIRWIGTAEEFETTDNPYARQFADATLEGPLTD
jgi:phospholipid/cholesterol/gamma-HCH transport system ATP-binding protein